MLFVVPSGRESTAVRGHEPAPPAISSSPLAPPPSTEPKAKTPQAELSLHRKEFIRTVSRFLKELVDDNPKLVSQRLGLMLLDNALVYGAFFGLGNTIRLMRAGGSPQEFWGFAIGTALLGALQRGFVENQEKRTARQHEREIERSVVSRVLGAVDNIPLHLCKDREVDNKVVQVRSNEMWISSLGNHAFSLTKGLGNAAIAAASFSSVFFANSSWGNAVLFPLVVIGLPALFELNSAEVQSIRRIDTLDKIKEVNRVFNYYRQRVLTTVGALLFKLWGKSDDVSEMYMQKFDQVAEPKEATERANFRTQGHANLVGAAASFGGFLKLAYLASLKELSTGSFIFLFSTLGKAHRTVQEVGENLGEISEKSRHLSALYELEDLGREIAKSRKKASFESAPDIVIEGLELTYPGASKPALSIDSLNIPAGSRVVMVGPNGAGKSTFMELLCGILEPTKGNVLVGGNNTRESWYHLSYIPQIGPDFAAHTVREALDLRTVGGPCCDEAEILERTGVTEILAGKKHGIHTRIGSFKDGSGFSGGQTQRIGLAAALLSSAKLQLLDEALTALDPPTQIELASLLNQQQGKTVLSVTHQLAAAPEADLILVFENGRISAQGKHHELMSQKGSWYEKHFSQQAGRYAVGNGANGNSSEPDLEGIKSALIQLPPDRAQEFVERAISSLRGLVPSERPGPAAPPN